MTEGTALEVDRKGGHERSLRWTLEQRPEFSIHLKIMKGMWAHLNFNSKYDRKRL